jgi:hypothetical protein
VDVDSKVRAQTLRAVVEKVEKKAHVAPDNPDLVALRHIVEHKITELETNQDVDAPPSAIQPG